MNFIELLKPGALVTRGYAERLLKDIAREAGSRFPSVGGLTLRINHPVFVFGHLSLYPVQLAEMTGISTDGMEVPAQYPDLFKMGVQCVDDPMGEHYPRIDEVTQRFFSATDALLSRLEQIELNKLSLPLENPARRERFGTVGAFLSYILLAHPQSHFGQISAWRRCMGLGPA